MNAAPLVLIGVAVALSSFGLLLYAGAGGFAEPVRGPTLSAAFIPLKDGGVAFYVANATRGMVYEDLTASVNGTSTAYTVTRDGARIEPTGPLRAGDAITIPTRGAITFAYVGERVLYAVIR